MLAGVKLKLGLLVVRAEYRTFELSGTPIIHLDHRIYVGAGISFEQSAAGHPRGPDEGLRHRCGR